MRNNSKQLSRLALFVAALTLLSGLFAAWGWSGRVRAAQQQERHDLNLFLDASSAGWAEVTDQFFTVPESAAQSMSGLLPTMDSTDEQLVLLAETVRSAPALDAAFIGYPDGEFVYVGRSDEAGAGGFRTRQISIDEGVREVTLTWTDSLRTELIREQDPTDTYDPRARPWYLMDGESTNWTAPYLFSSSQQPGITYSRQVLDPTGEPVAVVGIDIRLTELGGFLEQLAPGSNGEAMVVDVQGNVIAGSTMDSPPLSLSDVEGVLSDDSMSQLAASIDRVRSGEVQVARAASVDGESTTVTRAVRGADDWYLTAQALDADFLGDFSNGSAQNLAGILIIGLATSVLVGSLGLWFMRYRDGLKAEAEHDELTGLLTRRALRRILDDRLSRGRDALAVAIVDLDGFKAVNDTHGHLVGDEVLVAMAQRVDGFATSEGAQAGRLGGDEFAIIGSPTVDWEALVHQLGEPLTVNSMHFDLAGSVGVAHASPKDARSAEDVLREADQALFSAKRAGGGRAHVDEGAVQAL